MPAIIDYKEVLQEVKERTCHYDTQPYAQAYENSFTYTIHSKLQSKDFLVKVEGVRDTAHKTKNCILQYVFKQTIVTFCTTHKCSVK